MGHTVLIVKIENDEELDEQMRAWRISHAVPTLKIVRAWFDYGPVSNDPTKPMRFPDGTYRVHAPSHGTLTTLMTQLIPHEGLIIVGEEDEEGDGIHPIDFIEIVAQQPR